MTTANCAPAFEVIEGRLKLDVGSLRKCEGIVDVHTKVPDRVLDVGMAQQDLNGPQVSRGFVDQRGLCPCALNACRIPACRDR
jgi:hypothetical protein